MSIKSNLGFEIIAKKCVQRSGLLLFTNILIVKGFLTRGAQIFGYNYAWRHG